MMLPIEAPGQQISYFYANFIKLDDMLIDIN